MAFKTSDAVLVGLVLVASASQANADTAICNAFVTAYRQVLRSEAKPEHPQDVLTNLSAAPSGKLSLAPTVIEDVEASGLATWAKKQTPPVSISQDLYDAIASNSGARQDLDQAVGTNFYVVNGTDGTEACYQPGVYFRIENGVATKASGPSGWDKEDSGCRALRYFGTVNGTPVALEEVDPDDGTTAISVTPWTGNGFGSDCTIAFKFGAKGKLLRAQVK